MSTLTQTERVADRVRGELIQTIEELERRRSAALDFTAQLRAHLGLVASVVGLAVVSLGAGLYLWRVRRRNQRVVLRRERLRAALRAWNRPRRVVKEPEAPRARKLTRGLAVVLVDAFAKRASRKRRLPASVV